ncbi:MAG: DNA gyrase subunit A [Acidobacteria bacterium]|nr:DNA gyrase subunit A [Acidobacteriota bacterium]MCI0719192.1 DNA gyrase subunit A [Acidobacteriota bacterium]
MENQLTFNQTPVNIEDEMKRSYIDYAMSVIIGRALPDVRDGLKPVHRRILFGMHEMGLAHNKPYRKCAKIVGEVMGNFHPHGDAAIYDALVRMAQEFSMRSILIDGQGNFGSVDGDPPAAMRYTEARLARIAGEMLADIERETVDFTPTYDESQQEPVYLPTQIPNLLVNGSEGIAVGMATKIPPHNLKEVIDAVILQVNKPDASLEEIIKLIPGPDFPTGGFIYGKAGIQQAYATGRGSIIMRAKAAIEKQARGDKEMIVITEIPYQINKAKLIERIAELVQEKKIEGITDLRDESDREGLRIVIELRRGEQPEVILNNLYKQTQMQTSFGVIMLAIVNGQPRVLNLQDVVKHFVEHRLEVVRRRTRYELRKAEERAHILDGLKKALDKIDPIIKLIRASKSPQEAREGLIRQFEFSQLQAQAILDMQLQRLTSMEREKILEELENLLKRIAELKEILANDKVLRTLAVKELKEVQKQYSDDRRTQIVDEHAEIKLEDLISMEDVVVTVTHSGYLKRTPVSDYRQQQRGGKGRIGMRTREEDFVEYLFVASTHSYLLIFTNQGKVHWLKVYEIPDVGTAGKGKAIVNLVNLGPDEKMTAVLPVTDFASDRFVMFATLRGVVKKTRLDAFSNPMARGIIAISVDEGDELIAVELTTGKDQIFLGTHDGQCIRFHEDDVRDMGRQARGVKGIELAGNDYLVGMTVSADEGMILSVTENGYGKRTLVNQYRAQSRGGKGVINVKTTDKNGKVVAIMKVDDASELIVITAQGKIIRLEAAAIRAAGRSTQGVKLIDLGDDDKVAAASLITNQSEKLLEEKPPTVH